MKAVRLTSVGKPLEERDIALPSPRAGEALIRVRACGICHSDAHYRAGTSSTGPLPLTLGHEVSGVVEEVGADVSRVKNGDRVCIHYLLTCRACGACLAGREQFCERGAMIGKHTDGGYAEYIVVPEWNVVTFPAGIPFNHGAVLMCSSSTSYHALRKARLKPGETVAVFGVGGLGFSAVQIARAMQAAGVFAVDVNAAKLQRAEELGATPVDARDHDPAETLNDLTHGKGVDVILELTGIPDVVAGAIRSLAVFGRLALVGISDRPAQIDTYAHVIGKESEIVGVSDHLREELPDLIDMVLMGQLDLSRVVERMVPLQASAINRVLDELRDFSSVVRTVIVP